MRYLIQLAIPALIIVVTALLLTRRRKSAPAQGDEHSSTRSDTGMFILILFIGATVAVISFIAIGEVLP